MTVSPFEVYMIMQLDSLISLFKGFAWTTGILGIVSLVFGVFNMIDTREDHPQYIFGKKCIKIVTWFCIPIFLVVTISATLLPNTKTIAAMYLVPTVVNNEQVQKLPEDLLKLFRELINEWTPKDRGKV